MIVAMGVGMVFLPEAKRDCAKSCQIMPNVDISLTRQASRQPWAGGGGDNRLRAWRGRGWPTFEAPEWRYRTVWEIGKFPWGYPDTLEGCFLKPIPSRWPFFRDFVEARRRLKPSKNGEEAVMNEAKEKRGGWDDSRACQIVPKTAIHTASLTRQGSRSTPPGSMGGLTGGWRPVPGGILVACDAMAGDLKLPKTLLKRLRRAEWDTRAIRNFRLGRKGVSSEEKLSEAIPTPLEAQNGLVTHVLPCLFRDIGQARRKLRPLKTFRRRP
jgi:hypothetical protein